MLGNYDAVYENSALLFFSADDKRYYENSRAGRRELLADCTEQNRQDLYDDVMQIWGDTPTLPDVTPPTFEDLKAAKLAEMSADFERRVAGAFTTSQGYLMQFSPDDAIKMQGAVTLMEATGQETGYITQANDETIPEVPLATMKAVMLEMIAAFAQCHARKQELRALINAAQDTSELDEIVISWPI